VGNWWGLTGFSILSNYFAWVEDFFGAVEDHCSGCSELGFFEDHVP